MWLQRLWGPTQHQLAGTTWGLGGEIWAWEPQAQTNRQCSKFTSLLQFWILLNVETLASAISSARCVSPCSHDCGHVHYIYRSTNQCALRCAISPRCLWGRYPLYSSSFFQWGLLAQATNLLRNISGELFSTIGFFIITVREQHAFHKIGSLILICHKMITSPMEMLCACQCNDILINLSMMLSLNQICIGIRSRLFSAGLRRQSDQSCDHQSWQH